MAAYLGRDTAPVYLDKEVFTDVTAWEKHEGDILVRVNFRGRDAFFLIHVEPQSTSRGTARGGFPRRMFHYFAHLDRVHGLPSEVAIAVKRTEGVRSRT